MSILYKMSSLRIDKVDKIEFEIVTLFFFFFIRSFDDEYFEQQLIIFLLQYVKCL